MREFFAKKSKQTLVCVLPGYVMAFQSNGTSNRLSNYFHITNKDNWEMLHKLFFMFLCTIFCIAISKKGK